MVQIKPICLHSKIFRFHQYMVGNSECIGEVTFSNKSFLFFIRKKPYTTITQKLQMTLPFQWSFITCHLLLELTFPSRLWPSWLLTQTSVGSKMEMWVKIGDSIYLILWYSDINTYDLKPIQCCRLQNYKKR